ncbi:MAG: hypothetical protein AB2770_13235 [Candidatus Thiodiazotropha taylori]
MEARSKSPLSSREHLEKLVSLFLSKAWLSDVRTETTYLFDEAACPDEEKLLLHLIDKFEFVSFDDVQNELGVVLESLFQKWHITPAETIVTTLSRDDRADSGETLLGLLRKNFVKLGLNRDQLVSKLSAAPGYINAGSNTLVIVDDFTGTGKSLERKLNWLKSKVSSNELRIFYICTASMTEAKSRLEHYPNGYYVHRWLKKGISDYFTNQELIRNKKLMLRLESQLPPYITRKFSFGFGKSETLYNFCNQTSPNNVFPIFWCDKFSDETNRPVMFPRR